jgi:hypothetical protein
MVGFGAGQQPVQGRRVRVGPFGEGLHRRRAGHELIGDAQGRSGIQCLGDPEPAEEFNHPHRRREFVGLHGSPFDGGPSRPGSRHAVRDQAPCRVIPRSG